MDPPPFDSHPLAPLEPPGPWLHPPRLHPPPPLLHPRRVPLDPVLLAHQYPPRDHEATSLPREHPTTVAVPVAPGVHPRPLGTRRQQLKRLPRRLPGPAVSQPVPATLSPRQANYLRIPTSPSTPLQPQPPSSEPPARVPPSRKAYGPRCPPSSTAAK